MKQSFVAIAYNLRSLYNVGSLFRTADSLGVEKLYLVGTSGHPHPEEPWRRDHQKLHKTALGAEQTVTWEYHETIDPLIKKLRTDNYQIIGLELTKTSRSLASWEGQNRPLALIIGNEITGIPNEILAMSDLTLHIPMHGNKESLNVSVAFGMAVFWLINSTRLTHFGTTSEVF
jgi:tRNA G18 (ribose-2'-O)-methylase SpoU